MQTAGCWHLRSFQLCHIQQACQSSQTCQSAPPSAVRAHTRQDFPLWKLELECFQADVHSALMTHAWHGLVWLCSDKWHWVENHPRTWQPRRPGAQCTSDNRSHDGSTLATDLSEACSQVGFASLLLLPGVASVCCLLCFLQDGMRSCTKHTRPRPKLWRGEHMQLHNRTRVPNCLGKQTTYSLVTPAAECRADAHYIVALQ